jgi:hypothetical protein
MNVTLLKAIVVLVPACLLFADSLLVFLKGKPVYSFLYVLGSGCLVVVALTHISEALQLLPWMHWATSIASVIISISGVLFLESVVPPRVSR